MPCRILGAGASGRLLTRYGPARVAPAILFVSALLFAVEWSLLGFPRTAATLLYLHSTVLGAIGISAFWSMMNERLDPHSAKALIARTAGAATLGGLLGGLGAERVAAILSPAALLLVLAALGMAAAAGALTIARGSAAIHPRAEADQAPQPWKEVRRTPLLRHLALVTILAAAMAALTDYLIKAQAVAWLGKGEPLVRFFGIFYAATGAGAFLLQVAFGRFALARLGLGGSVATHPAVVGITGLLGFAIPTPWSGILPRGLDMTLRNSLVRAGYELLYTPLPPSAKRSAKSLIDVTGDSIGKALGAGLALAATRLAPAYALVAINVAIVIAAALEFAVARRLKVGYVTELEGGLRRHSDELPESTQQPLNQATIMLSLTGMDASLLQQEIAEKPASDPVVAAYAALRSGNSTRVRSALDTLPRDPALIGALVALLENRHTLKQTTAALRSFGPRAAGEMISALLDNTTPEAVRRRLPLVSKTASLPWPATDLSRRSRPNHWKSGRVPPAGCSGSRRSFPRSPWLRVRWLRPRNGNFAPVTRRTLLATSFSACCSLPSNANRLRLPPGHSTRPINGQGGPLSSTSRLCCPRYCIRPFRRCWQPPHPQHRRANPLLCALTCLKRELP